MRWLKEGDANSKFFHRCIKKRRKINEILGLNFDGSLVEGVEPLKNEIMGHFERHFKSEGGVRPMFGNLNVAGLEETDSNFLVSPFLEEEIKDAVWNCESSKSPGPDGISLSFIKQFWEEVKGDFTGFLDEFHRNGRLVKGSNSSFIVLIPKKENPQKISDFRPISLIGCMYKVLPKVLANRLRRVIHRLISDCQSAFIKGRQILDGVLIANEVLDDVKRRKKEAVLFKVDFEKAYDSVSWEFLDFMMRQMSFNEIWRRWIRECLSTSSVSILVNGSPMREFKVGRGLCQGDLLSPFLFHIVAEGLNVMFREVVQQGLYKGYQVGELSISHL